MSPWSIALEPEVQERQCCNEATPKGPETRNWASHLFVLIKSEMGWLMPCVLDHAMRASESIPSLLSLLTHMLIFSGNIFIDIMLCELHGQLYPLIDKSTITVPIKPPQNSTNCTVAGLSHFRKMEQPIKTMSFSLKIYPITPPP